MNDSWPHASKEFDEDTLDALRIITEAATQHRIPFLLVGAMARDMLLQHVHDMSRERRTMDVDIGVMVGSWAEYSEFCEALSARGLEHNPAVEHRFRTAKGIIIDVVPFGGLADANGFISWPPDDDPMMRVTGFGDALRHCLRMEVGDGLVVNIVSLPGLATLKLLAWNDRRYATDKDAQDLALLLRVYGEVTQDRLFDSEAELLERHGFDIKTAGAELLGQDMAAMASVETAPHLLRIMLENGEDTTPNEHLVRDISRHLPGRDYQQVENMLKFLLSGLVLYEIK